MKRADMEQLWREVEANKGKLDSCAGPHDFECTNMLKPLGAEWRCTKCHGEVRGPEAYWYNLGMQHAREQTQRTLSEDT